MSPRIISHRIPRQDQHRKRQTPGPGAARKPNRRPPKPKKKANSSTVPPCCQATPLPIGKLFPHPSKWAKDGHRLPVPPAITGEKTKVTDKPKRADTNTTGKVTENSSRMGSTPKESGSNCTTMALRKRPSPVPNQAQKQNLGEKVGDHLAGPPHGLHNRQLWQPLAHHNLGSTGDTQSPSRRKS